MQPAGILADERGQGIDVSAFELRELPVFEHQSSNLMLASESFKDVRRSRGRLSLAVLHRRRKLEIVIENFGQLLRRIDVERRAGNRMDLLGETLHLAIHPL